MEHQPYDELIYKSFLFFQKIEIHNDLHCLLYMSLSGPVDAWIRFNSIDVSPYPVELLCLNLSLDIDVLKPIGSNVAISVVTKKTNLNWGFQSEVSSIGLLHMYVQ